MEPRFKQLTERQKADLLLSLVQGKVTLAEVCRKHGLEAREVEEWVKSVLGPDAKLPLPPPPKPRIDTPPSPVGVSVPSSGALHSGEPSSDAAPGSSFGGRKSARGRDVRREAAVPMPGEDPITRDGSIPPDADRTDRRIRVRRRRRRHRRVHQTESARKTSRVVADWIWALSPILIGLGIGLAVLFLIWLGYFEPAPPPQ